MRIATIAGLLAAVILVGAPPAAHSETEQSPAAVIVADTAPAPEVLPAPPLPEQASPRTTQPPADPDVLDCAYAWQRLAPWSFAVPRCEFFVAEHERLKIKEQWPASMTYGLANFGLTIGKRAPGLCYGPMDVKWPGYARQAGCRRPNDLRDPRRNIKAHCLEAREGVRRGHTGLALCRWIMYPARPHDWGGGRFRKTWAKLHKLLSAGYAAGKLEVAK